MKTKQAFEIYDNGGLTADRYTLVFLLRIERKDLNSRRNIYEALGFNEIPFHPQGFAQHTVAMRGKHLGKKINLTELNEDCRRLISQELGGNQ